jgi:predicted transposase YdaD
LKEVHVIRSPYAEELRNEGRAEGRTEGRLSSLLLMVKTKFGASPRNLKAQLLKITQERDWDELFVAAVTAVSIAEFSAVVAAKVG